MKEFKIESQFVVAYRQFLKRKEEVRAQRFVLCNHLNRPDYPCICGICKYLSILNLKEKP